MVEAVGGGLAAVRAVQQTNASDQKCIPVLPSEPKPAAKGPRTGRLFNASQTAHSVPRISHKRQKKINPKSTTQFRSKDVEQDSSLVASEEIERSRVKDPCMRGISFGQLLDFFTQECGRVALEDSSRSHWQLPLCRAAKLAQRCFGRNQAKCVEISEGRMLELTPNLYAADELVITPKCEADCVSMAELWNPVGLLIRIFISHCWSENFGDFVQGLYRFLLTLVAENNAGLTSIEMHTRVRELSLYIWAFCNNRWKTDNVKRLEDSLFYKVLQADSTWYVVLSLDYNMRALQRAWCTMEFFLATSAESSVVVNTRHGPLHQLVPETKEEELWLLQSADLLQCIDAGRTQASRRNDLELIQKRVALIDSNASVEGLSGSSVVNKLLRSSLANATVHHLARIGNAVALKDILDNSADPNARDHHYIRPLTYAAATHGVDSEVVKLLLDRGADALALQAADAVASLFDQVDATREDAIAKVRQLDGEAKDFHASTLFVAEHQSAERAVNRQACSLASSNSEERLVALQLIARHGMAAASAAACRLGDSVLAIRAEAENVLAGIDLISVAAPNLALLLKHEDQDVQKRAARWLGECGEEASYYLTDIVELLGDTNLEVSTEAKQALLNLGEYAIDAITEIVQFLRCAAAHVRCGAAEVLEGLPQETWSGMFMEAIDLSALLMDEHESLRKLVASVLADENCNISKVLAPIVAFLGGVDCEARLAAQRAFESLGKLAVDVAPDIARLLSHDEHEIRSIAADTLCEIEWLNSPRAIHIAKSFDFAKLLADADETIRNVAIVGLEKLGDSAADVATQVVSLICNPDLEVRQRGAELLETLENLAPAFARALAKLFKSKDAAVRIAAAAQMSQLGVHAADFATGLATLLADTDADVRAEAVKALEALAENAQAAAPKLAKLLKHNNVEVRMSAAQVLQNLGMEEGEPGAIYAKDIAKVLGQDASEEEPQGDMQGYCDDDEEEEVEHDDQGEDDVDDYDYNESHDEEEEVDEQEDETDSQKDSDSGSDDVDHNDLQTIESDTEVGGVRNATAPRALKNNDIEKDGPALESGDKEVAPVVTAAKGRQEKKRKKGRRAKKQSAGMQEASQLNNASCS